MKQFKRVEIKSIHHQSKKDSQYEIVVIGAGPAGILIVADLLKKNDINPQKILWIDKEFKVGAFGKQWANVPGNTEVRKYRAVYEPIFKLLSQKYHIKLEDDLLLMIDALKDTYTCSLKAAAEPMQLITNIMCKIVDSVEGNVTNINTLGPSKSLMVTNNLGEIVNYTAQRIVMVTGAEAKTVPLTVNDNHKALALEVVLSREELAQYMEKNPRKLTHVAVVGSSHSAALAVMNLLQAQVRVTQFMNKEYRFAEVIEEKGEQRIQYDNTGLKGKVAEWTKKLINNKEIFAGWRFVMGELDDLSKYSHVVSAIGLRTADTLKINGKSPSCIPYKNDTTTDISGLYVFGSGFPQEQTFPEGKEKINGVGKYAKSAEEAACNKKSTERIPYYGSIGLFSTSKPLQTLAPGMGIISKL